jgi:hypothetical protein
MESNRKPGCLFPFATVLPGLLFGRSASSPEAPPVTCQGKTIGIAVNPADGAYTISDPAPKKPILRSPGAAEVDHHWLSAILLPASSCLKQSAQHCGCDRISEQRASSRLLDQRYLNTGLLQRLQV